jgi:hypothetical protein
VFEYHQDRGKRYYDGGCYCHQREHKAHQQNNQNYDNSNALSNKRNKNHNRRRNHSHKKDGDLLSKPKIENDTNETTLKREDLVATIPNSA